jgi:O-antigen/teichoic acid export membrane protein
MTLVTTMGFGLVLRILLPRIFGVEKMGLFYFAESLCLIVFTFLPLGIHAYINRYIPGDPEEAARVFRPVIIYKIIFGMILIAGLYSYLKVMEYDAFKSKLVMIFSLNHFFLTLNNDILKPFVLAMEEVQFVSRLDIIAKILQVGGVCLVLWWDPQLDSVLWAYAATSFIPVLVLFGFAYKRGWFTRRGSSAAIYSSVVMVGLPFFVNSALQTFSANIDIAILNEIANEVEVGLYGAAQKLKGVLMMVVPLLSSAIIPLLSKTRKESQQHYEQFLRQLYRTLVVLSFPAALTMVLFSKEIVTLLYGDEFVESGTILAVLAPVVVFTYINVFLSMNLTLVSNGRMLTILTLTAIVLNAVTNFILIPYGLRYDPVGGGGMAASVTTLLAEFVTCAGLIYLTPTVILTARIMKDTLLVVIPLACVIIFNATLSEWSLPWRFGLLLGSMAYIFLTGMMTKSELQFFRKSLLAKMKS